jgi:hypothetical protein
MSRIEPWMQKMLTNSQLFRIITDTPSFESPATRLALSGEEIMRNARDTAARSQLEISGAIRRG